MLFASLFVFVLSAVAALPVEKPRNFTNFRLIDGQLPSLKLFQVVEGLSNEGRLELWADLPSEDGSILFSVGPESYVEVINAVTKAGIKTSVLEDDLQKVIDEERGSVNYALPIERPFELDSFESYDQIVTSIDFYAEQPRKEGRVSKFVVGKTYEGRDIVGIKISNSKKDKPIIFLECGIHAREWASTSTCLYMIDQLVSHQEEHKDLLKRFDFQFVPVANPDGYEYTRSKNRLWRKNRRPQSPSTCIGVDLNRNFKAGPHSGIGTSDFACSDIYCGEAPFSEPETAAMRDYMTSIKDKIEYYVSLHSFGLMWMFPYGYTGKHTKDHDELFALAKAGVEAIEAETGTEYKFGAIAETIYAVTGSSIDWAYESLNIKKTFVLELQPSLKYARGGRGFLLPAKQIISVGEETFTGLKAMWLS